MKIKIKNNDNTFYNPSDEVVCFCSDLKKSEILNAVINGCRTIKEVRDFTNKKITGFCEEMNPTGKCCHPQFDSIIRQAGKSKFKNMTNQEIAIDYFRKDFNCAQSVLAPFGPVLGIAEDECLKIACAFGGGMARQQHTCGAVTGALMVLGLKFGRAMNDSEDKKTETYQKTIEFFKAFEAENGSINCKALLQGLNMNDEKDLMKIKELGLFKTSCEKYVKDAVEIVERMK